MVSLSPAQERILVSIARRKGALPLSVREMCKEARVSSTSYVVSALDKLEAMGLVRRRGGLSRTVVATSKGALWANVRAPHLVSSVIPETKCPKCNASMFGVTECWICKEKKT